MKKLYLSWTDINNMMSDITQQMATKMLRPHVVLGPGRGGFPIGVMMSHYFDTKFIPFKGSLRDHPNWETDWKLPSHWTIKNGKRKILIVDDICDEGDTLKKITEDIAKAYPKSEIKTCALVQNKNNVFTVDYYGVTINKAEKPCWVVFACENWW